MTIPLQFASLYDRQEVFVLLDLGTDFLVGNTLGITAEFRRFKSACTLQRKVSLKISYTGIRSDLGPRSRFATGNGRALRR